MFHSMRGGIGVLGQMGSHNTQKNRLRLHGVGVTRGGVQGKLDLFLP